MKLYVLVRKDMSLSQIAVQAGHAVGAFCKERCNDAILTWDDTLIYLGVENEEALIRWKKTLEGMDCDVVEWREGYWNNSLTSISFLGTPTARELVKELKLV